MTSRARRIEQMRRHFGLALVAVLCLASWIATGAHWIATPHRLCAIHGTIEHSEAEPRTTPATSGDQGPVYQEAERPHAECPDAPWARTEVFPVARAPVETIGVLDEASFPRVEREVPVLGRARYRLAPSRSPPS